MTSFIYPSDIQYELVARFPGTRVSTLKRSRSALRINLDVWRARRTENRD